MTRRSRRLLQLGVLALLAGLAAGLALALAHEPSAARVDLRGRPLAVRQELTPRDPQFGDTVTATVDVFSDPSRVSGDSLRVKTDFRPYAVASAMRTVRTAGNLAVTHVETRLRCLELRCVPLKSVATFRFEPVRVSYRDRATARSVTADWPALRVHSRVTKTGIARPALRVPAPVAAPSRYRLPPGPTGYALLALAGLLAAAGAGLLLWVALRRLAPGRRRVAPLEQVLRELAASSSNGDAGRRRRALEALARELEPLDEPLSVETRVLAWGPDEPRPEAISDLAGRVRTAVRR